METKLRIVLALFFIISSSCKKLIEIEPPRTALTADALFSKDESAIAAATQLYANAASSDPSQTSFLGLSTITGLSSDEFAPIGFATSGIAQDYARYYSNTLRALNANGRQFWDNFYAGEIYNSNRIIEGLSGQKISEVGSGGSGLSAKVKRQLLGEMQFMRAFAYFYLVQLYGDVALLTTTNYFINSTAPRVSKDLVYQQIIKDLQDAMGNLSDTYLQSDVVTTTSTSPRIRPIKWAAKALLARVYLYTGNNQGAEAESKDIINNTTLYRLTSLDNVFKANSNEAIWQLQPVVAGRNTQEGWFFMTTTGGISSGNNLIQLNNSLVAAFEPSDQRKAFWINSLVYNGSALYYPTKYKSATLNSSITEYSTILRLAEQYLICAEACAKNSKILEAQGFLNAIRNRAGLGNTTANTKDALLDAILAERRVELFSEFGHRWFDLKRTGKVEEVMRLATPQKASVDWEPYQAFYPISPSQIILNSNVIQTPGY